MISFETENIRHTIRIRVPIFVREETPLDASLFIIATLMLSGKEVKDDIAIRNASLLASYLYSPALIILFSMTSARSSGLRCLALKLVS